MTQTVHIVGPLSLQNELAALYLEKEADFQCACHDDASPADVLRRLGENNGLLLWDCHGQDEKGLTMRIGRELFECDSTCLVALFNLPYRGKIEKQALSLGIRGVFYHADTPAIIARGIRAIFEGELWFPRDTLSECITQRIGFALSEQAAPSFFTRREKEILQMICAGKTNREIADALYISIPTVKTHLYHIYRKIDVPNRFQAAMWAAKNLWR